MTKRRWLEAACAFATALVASAAPAQPSPTPDLDPTALCWAAMTDAYIRHRSRANPPPAARDSFEETLREAMGYFNGVVRSKYPADEQLSQTMQAGMTAFRQGDQPRIVGNCLSAYGEELKRFARLVRPYFER